MTTEQAALQSADDIALADRLRFGRERIMAELPTRRSLIRPEKLGLF